MKDNHYVRMVMMVGAVLFLLSAPLMAMEKEHGPDSGPVGGGRPVKHEKGFWKEEEKSLGLSEEQRTKMKLIRQEARTQQEATRTAMKARHDALRQELDAAQPDRGKAELIVKEISVLEEKMGLQRVDMVLKIREMLTPEQYKKLQAFHEKKRSEFKQHRGKMKDKKAGE